MSVIEQKSLVQQEETTHQELQEVGNEFEPISLVKLSDNGSDKTVNLEELNDAENESQ